MISGVCFKADKSSYYTRYSLAKTKLQPSFQVQMLIISLSVTIMKIFFSIFFKQMSVLHNFCLPFGVL